MSSAVAKAYTAEPARPKPVKPPAFLLKHESGLKVFFSNLADCFRKQAPIKLTSRPATFWPDVFVSKRPWGKGLAVSTLYHAGLLSFLYLVPFFALLSERPVVTEPRQTTLTYYNVSEYLPPINPQKKLAVPKSKRPPDPAYAAQPIISVPQSLDNLEQTVVDPSSVRLNQHIPLPNLVVATPTPAPPVAAVERSTAKLILPTLSPQVVQPAPDPASRQISQLELAGLPKPAIIEPAPLPDSMQRKLGDINLARVEHSIQPPKLPVVQQRAATSNPENIAGPKQEEIAPPPSLPASSATGGEKAVGQVLALGLNPVLPNGPITLPEANRRGEFAAIPEGRPGASGAPPAPTSIDTSNRDSIHVGGDAPGGSGVIVAKPAHDPTKSRLFASLARPSVTELARQSRPAGVQDPSPVEAEVFGGKRYYSLTMNMPNLTSSSGSWVVRFAELNPTPVRGDLTAPVATAKVDPAYPAELMRSGVEGTVVLYAVIRSDGSVSSVRVLRGFDSQLDENARLALSRWHFRPATKNGEAVDLEAVVQIPFRGRAY
jgi:TonB family protein